MTKEMMVLKVAVDAPVEGVFDYLSPVGWAGGGDALAGRRVRVPFGASVRVGVVVATDALDDASPDLKAVEAVLDDAPLLDADDLRLGQWLAGYYHAPLGEVLALMLPASLRGVAALHVPEVRGWRVLLGAPLEVPGAARQTQVLRQLHAAAGGLSAKDLRGLTAVLRALERRGWVEQGVLARSRLIEGGEANVCAVCEGVAPSPQPSPARGEGAKTGAGQACAAHFLPSLARGERAKTSVGAVVADVPPLLALNAEQVAAHEAITAHLGQFGAFLLHGITGSGKTEVYLAAMTAALQRGLQVLVLVPEIVLTPQLVGRFAARFKPLGAEAIVVLHSAMTTRARELAWQAAQSGRARVVLGTRSAVLTPLPRLGLIVVDEEHDPSYKQQEGWRYHARDVAVVRAQQRGIPLVLGSATPSLESLAQVAHGRYRLLRLTARAGGARSPRLALLDVRKRPLQDGLSAPLLEKMKEHLLAGGQVLLFLNRRGFAPALECHACGHVEVCRQCSAPMTVHRGRGRLVCHHCGAERAVPRACAACGSHDLQMPGQGTERLELALRGLFPEFALERIDRDTTRRKGELEDKLARAHSGEARILLGTQMLAKGHDFPGVTLAVILDADSGLMSSDFRAPERLLQLIVQVAGRAGRADKSGEVVIQTHQPEHPLLQALLHGGFERCAELLMRERELARLPPFAHLALLRAEAKDAARAQGFLARCAAFFKDEATEALQVWGPAPAPLEKRAGRYRFQLLLQSGQRAPLHRAIGQFAAAQAAWTERRGVKWSLDIDPQEMA